MSARAVDVRIGHPTGPCKVARCVGYRCEHIPMEWERIGWSADCADHEDFQPDTVATRQEARRQAALHNATEHPEESR